LHTKYFKRFTTKMQLFLSQINNDIKFEDSVEINRTKRKSMMETFANDNIDKNILLDLKKSIVDEMSENFSTSTPPNTPTSQNSQNVKNNITSLNGIFLRIDEDAVEDNIENKKVEDKIRDNIDNIDNNVIKEEDKEDNISILTNSDISESKNEKPKRKYKPRKKKGEQ